MIDIITLMLITVFSVILFMLLYIKKISKPKKFSYRVIFLREQNELLVFYTSIKLSKIEKDIIQFANKTFNVVVNECSYINKKQEFVYFVDYDSGTSYPFYAIESIQPDTLEMLVSNSLVTQITKGLSRDKFDWKNFLFGVICGAFVMLIVMFIMSEVKDTDIIYTNNTPGTFITIIKNLRLKI